MYKGQQRFVQLVDRSVLRIQSSVIKIIRRYHSKNSVVTMQVQMLLEDRPVSGLSLIVGSLLYSTKSLL